MGIDILGIDIMGVDILGIDIVALPQENNYCKTTSLNACGLLLLLWTRLENISRILIFADLYLPRNCAKIGQRENFPFYGT